MRVNLDDAEIERLLRSPEGPVAKDLLRRGAKVESAAIRLCPRDTGRLAGSIDHELDRDERGLVVRVGSNIEYSRHVEEGTGLYGPFKQRIVPTTKQALAFTVGGRRVVVASIAGARAQPFLRPALKAAED
jgi:hypothetical protein